MVEPLRCGGLSYNDKGELITGSGKLWSDIVKEHENERQAERLAFLCAHKETLIAHGAIKL